MMVLILFFGISFGIWLVALARAIWTHFDNELYIALGPSGVALLVIFVAKILPMMGCGK